MLTKQTINQIHHDLLTAKIYQLMHGTYVELRGKQPSELVEYHIIKRVQEAVKEIERKNFSLEGYPEDDDMIRYIVKACNTEAIDFFMKRGE